MMKRSFLSLVLVSCLMLLGAAGCADKNSTEACQYETTINLDKGNYDAVLASGCATPLQVGAAYFGKAGFSVTKVVNALVTAQARTGSVSTDTSLREYMSSLTGKITDNTITLLDQSREKYAAVPPASEFYRDARFTLSIVDAIKALSLIKTVIDLSGIGTLSTCDINGNGKPDEADALVCALLVSGSPLTGGACPGPLATEATYTTTSSDLFFGSPTGTAYRGVTATMAGTPSASCQASYQKLLYYSTADGTYYLATTSGLCQATDGSTWPCPATSNLDMVTALQNSIIGSIDALSTSLTSSGSDVQQSIQDIKVRACGTDTVCTPAEVADYVQTYL